MNHSTWPASEPVPPTAARREAPAFSLLELVMVIVILSILAGIAVPRLADARRRAGKAAREATITNVQNAIEMYHAEHDRYPGYNPADGSSSGTWFVDQLTKHTDADGAVSDTYGYPFIYGPYLRGDFPANPANDLNTVKVRLNPSAPLTSGEAGWIADLSTGDFDAYSGGGTQEVGL